MFKSNKAVYLGGSIHLSNTNYSIEGSCFINNNIYNKYQHSADGGAIYFQNSNGFLKKCTFNCNSITSEISLNFDTQSGGALSVKKSVASFEECNFTHNSIKRNKITSNGGALSFIDSKGSFKKCIFDNNEAISPTQQNGGAVEFIRSKGSFNECLFNNNIVLSESSDSSGGAASFIDSNGDFMNCTFINNTAITLLDNFLISGDEPRIKGGAIYMGNSNFMFVNCSFTNNTGFGNSPEFVTTGYGGALFSLQSNVHIKGSLFDNNSLLHYGYKFDINNNIEGGACYFYNSKVELENSNFINNTAQLQVKVISKYFSTNIIGGAIFSYSSKFPIVCTNCGFYNNSVIVPNKHQNEFAGAIFLNDGRLTNCSFSSNKAFNAKNIKFNQKGDSILLLNNNRINDKEINPMICFHSIKSGSSENYKIVANISTPDYQREFSKKFECINESNCTFPFNYQLKTKRKMIISSEDENQSIEFGSEFDTKCYILDENEDERKTKPTVNLNANKGTSSSLYLFTKLTILICFLFLLFLITLGISSRIFIKSNHNLNLE